MTTLSDLARAKAIFQQRAVCAALGIKEGAVSTDALGLAKESGNAAPSTNKESE